MSQSNLLIANEKVITLETLVAVHGWLMNKKRASALQMSWTHNLHLVIMAKGMSSVGGGKLLSQQPGDY